MITVLKEIIKMKKIQRNITLSNFSCLDMTLNLEKNLIIITSNCIINTYLHPYSHR